MRVICYEGSDKKKKIMSHDNEVTAKVNKYLHAAPKLALVMDPQSTITINRNKICTKYIYSNTNTRYAL